MMCILVLIYVVTANHGVFRKMWKQKVLGGGGVGWGGGGGWGGLVHEVLSSVLSLLGIEHQESLCQQESSRKPC